MPPLLNHCFGRPESVTITCPLLRSRTAVTVVVHDWPSLDCTVMCAPASSEGSVEVSPTVERLEEQVRQLAGQYAREQTQLAAQVEALTENMQQLGAHVTILTNAYEELLKNVNEMINVSNAVVRDMNELIR